jgi:hypothetical protein
MDGGKQPVVESSQEVEIRQFLPETGAGSATVPAPT